MEVLYERKPSVEIQSMEEAHREEIKVWRGLFDDVCAKLERQKTVPNLNDTAQRDWFMAEIGIMNSKRVDETPQVTELLEKASRLERENKQLFIQNQWLQGSLHAMNSKTQSTVESWATAMDFEVISPSMDLVSSHDVSIESCRNVSTMSSHSAMVGPQSHTTMEQLRIENAWLQASLLIKEKSKKMEYSFMEDDILEMYSEDKVDEQLFINMAWMQASLLIKEANQEPALSQQDVALAWYQAEEIIQKSKAETSLKQQDLNLAWYQATIGIEKAASTLQSHEQWFLENHWLQGTLGIEKAEKQRLQESVAQKQLESDWMQASFYISTVEKENPVDLQAALEVAWMQGTMGIAFSKTSRFVGPDQDYIEKSWLQASLLIAQDPTPVHHLERMLAQKELECSWLQGHVGILESQRNTMSAQEYIEKAWHQASQYIAQSKTSRPVDISETDLEALRLTRRSSDTRRSLESASGTRPRLRRTSNEEMPRRELRRSRSLKEEPEIQTRSLDRPLRRTSSLLETSAVPERRRSILKTGESTLRSEKRVEIVVPPKSRDTVTEYRTPSVDVKQSKESYLADIKSLIAKRRPSREITPSLHNPEEYQQVLKNAWLQGTLGILNAQKKMEQETKPFVTARQRLLARRNSKEKDRSLVEPMVTRSVQPVVSSNTAETVAPSTRHGPVSRSIPTPSHEITQQDLIMAWIQAENMILKEYQYMEAQALTDQVDGDMTILIDTQDITEQAIDRVHKQPPRSLGAQQTETNSLEEVCIETISSILDWRLKKPTKTYQTVLTVVDQQWKAEKVDVEAQAYLQSCWFQAESLILKAKQTPLEAQLAKVLFIDVG
jgi:hypothetical protein